MGSTAKMPILSVRCGAEGGMVLRAAMAPNVSPASWAPPTRPELLPIRIARVGIVPEFQPPPIIGADGEIREPAERSHSGLPTEFLCDPSPCTTCPRKARTLGLPAGAPFGSNRPGTMMKCFGVPKDRPW